jgi:hypothetical protein
MMDAADARLDHFARLEEMAAKLANVPVTVVWPVDETSPSGAIESVQADLIAPVLIGPKQQINKIAGKKSLSLAGLEIVSASTPEVAADTAVEMAVGGQVGGLMKRGCTPRPQCTRSSPKRPCTAVAE